MAIVGSIGRSDSRAARSVNLGSLRFLDSNGEHDYYLIGIRKKLWLNFSKSESLSEAIRDPKARANIEVTTLKWSPKEREHHINLVKRALVRAGFKGKINVIRNSDPWDGILDF